MRACTPKSLPSPRRFVQAGVSARRRGNLKSSLAPLGTGLRFTRNDNALNRDLGINLLLYKSLIVGYQLKKGGSEYGPDGSD